MLDELNLRGLNGCHFFRLPHPPPWPGPRLGHTWAQAGASKEVGKDLRKVCVILEGRFARPPGPGTPASGLHKVASGASAACGQTQISWTNCDQNNIYFDQVLHGKCTKRYLTQTTKIYDGHKRLSMTDTDCPWHLASKSTILSLSIPKRKGKQVTEPLSQVKHSNISI